MSHGKTKLTVSNHMILTHSFGSVQFSGNRRILRLESRRGLKRFPRMSALAVCWSYLARILLAGVILLTSLARVDVDWDRLTSSNGADRICAVRSTQYLRTFESPSVGRLNYY